MEVYSNRILSQETRKTLNRPPNFTPKTTRKKNKKKNPQKYQKERNHKDQNRNKLKINESNKSKV